MLRTNIKSIIVLFVIVGSSSLLIKQSTSSSRSTVPQNQQQPIHTSTVFKNQQQPIPEIIDCLNEYKSFDPSNKNVKKCKFYHKDGKPDVNSLQSKYAQYISNVLQQIEKLKNENTKNVFKDIVNNLHRTNHSNLTFIQSKIGNPGTISPADIRTKLEDTETNLQEIKVIDKVIDKLSKNSSDRQQEPNSPTIGGSESMIIILVLTITLATAAIFFLVVWYILQIKSQKVQPENQNQEPHTLIIKEIETSKELNVDNQNTSFSSSQISELSRLIKENTVHTNPHELASTTANILSERLEPLIKQLSELNKKENTLSSVQTDEIAPTIANIIYEKLKPLINQEISLKSEGVVHSSYLENNGELQKENDRLRKENQNLKKEQETDREDIRNLQKKYDDLLEENKRDRRKISWQENKISDLEKDIEDLKAKNQRGEDSYGYINVAKNIPQLSPPPDEEYKKSLQSPATVDLPPKIAELVTKYNNDPNTLWQHVAKVMIEVSEPEESYRQRRQDNSKPIIFKSLSSDTNENEQKSDYCVIPVTTEKGPIHSLFPKINRITDIQYQIICGHNSLFECSGYRGNNTNEFVMKQPATVFPRDTSQKEWQLKERGKIEFI